MGRLPALSAGVSLQMNRALALVSLLVGVSCTKATETDQHKARATHDLSTPTARESEKPATTPARAAPQPGLVSTLRSRAQALTPQTFASFRRFVFATEEERHWAAFGLGRHCPKLDSAAASGLLTQAISLWMAEAKPPSASLLNTASWALGSCGDRSSEDVLRSWLTADAQTKTQDLTLAGAFGLLALVDRRGTLSERTQTVILDAAQRDDSAELLAPLGRMARLSDAVGAHLLEVAGRFLTQADSTQRRSAIFALGSAGPSAAEPIAQVLLGHQYSVQERAAAAQALGLLGPAGQGELDLSISTLLAHGLPTSAQHPLWIPLISALGELHSAKVATSELRKLAGLVLPQGENQAAQAQRRRLIGLRCRAADLIAARNETSRSLLECDPDQGRPFALAQLRVLARSEIKGRQLVSYEAHLKSSDPVISQAALRLLPTHPELKSKIRWLLSTLQANVVGSKTLAAQLLYTYPAWITNEADVDVRAQVLVELGNIINQPTLPQETRAFAMLAAGALGALNLQSLILGACHGDDPLLYEPATTALGLLGTKNISCPQAPLASDPAAALNADAPLEPVDDSAANAKEGPITIVIDSDLGELKLILDPSSAPHATRHVLAKIEAGFYDKQHVGFGRYGLTVQFGDHDEDGYDEIAAPRLPFEVSPRPVKALSLGMSSFAPGAEDTQLFVTVSAAPQLFGSRVLLGRAEGPWELLTWGDELRSFKRLTK